jgi:penicillin amidase
LRAVRRGAISASVATVPGASRTVNRRPEPVMRRFLRIVVWTLAALAATVAGSLALGLWLGARSLPDYDRDFRLAELDAPVDIVRDANAVPHIFARSDADAMRALGWAHAQDRLWQMELQRRTAQGRLAELFGEEALPTDRAMRALDLDGRAAEALRAQDAQARALLDAYAQGVNARIRAVNEEALGRGAPELFLFGEDALAPWTAADSLSILKLMALRLTDAAAREARRARLLARLTPEQLVDLDPAAPPRQGFALDLPLPEETALRAPAPRHPLSPFPEAGAGGASNAWAVDGRRAAEGAPLLATDPHLWLSAPSIWMLARLTSPGFDVIGGSIPGVPAIVIGRNRDFGWGLTTTGLDDQDLYVEKLHPEDPTRYRTPEGWAEMTLRRETIRIRGGGSETVLLRATRHGPAPPPGSDLDFASVAPPGHVVALAWTALDAEDRSYESLLGLMRARSVEEGAEAAALHLAPAQNVVMADRDGVGAVVAGLAPLRREDSRSEGRLPSAGWLAENDWVGRVPVEALPRDLRPASGVVANANNRVTNAAFPRHLSFDWAAPYRIRRIERRLGERGFHTRESFAELQADVVSEMARAVLPLIARELWWGEPSGEGELAQLRGEALQRLAQWNGAMAEHDPEPLIFYAWMRRLTRRLAEDELGPTFAEIAGVRPLFVERVFRDVGGAARWCDVVKTPARETCPAIARRALDDALAELTRRFGDDLDDWRWGKAHWASHRHAPLGYFAGPDLIANIEHPSPGGDHTVNVGRTPGRGATPERSLHAAGLRAIYDFADLDRSLFVIATGQSGHPLSSRYDDLNRLWRRGEHIRMSLDPADARAGALGEARLTPD